MCTLHSECVCLCVCVCVRAREIVLFICMCVKVPGFGRKDEDKDRDGRWREKRNTKGGEKKGEAENETGVEMIWTRRHGWGEVNEAWLCVWRRWVELRLKEEKDKRGAEKESEWASGAERQHSPHIRGSDKDLGRRVWSVDFKETVHTLPKIRGTETDEITALSSQCAEQDQREKTNIIINNNNSSSRSNSSQRRLRQQYQPGH